MHFTDSHAHLGDDTMYVDVDAVVQRAQAAGVHTIVNICTDVDTLERGLALAQRYPFIRNVASTTPHDVATEGESFFPLVARHAKAGDLAAIGETGLDYHYTHSPKDLQQEYLRKYLELALEWNLPVVIHCRDAFADFFQILDGTFVKKGVLHCFTGTVQEAEEVLKRGWFVSISGIATFKKSEILRQVIEMAPLEQLLIETDAPYLAPVPHRGQRNEPAYVIEVAKLVASIKGISLEQVAAVTSENVRSLLCQ